MFGVAGNLSSLRMASFVRRSGGSKHKIAEDGPVRSREEGDKDIRAFAGGDKSRAQAIGDLPFAYHRSSVLEWVPMMNVGGGLGHLVRDEKSDMMGGEIA